VPATIDLEHLGLDSGGHLLIERALADLVLGARLRVRGTPPALRVYLPPWRRAHGHRMDRNSAELVIVRGDADFVRWAGAQRAGCSDDVAEYAERRWDWPLVARSSRPRTGAVLVDDLAHEGLLTC
jgi:hypothetical protein